MGFYIRCPEVKSSKDEQKYSSEYSILGLNFISSYRLILKILIRYWKNIFFCLYLHLPTVFIQNILPTDFQHLI
jgi:hypothetical protein